jgi:hypothetical protein
MRSHEIITTCAETKFQLYVVSCLPQSILVRGDVRLDPEADLVGAVTL